MFEWNSYTILGRKAETLALNADFVPCCPQLLDKSCWTGDSIAGTGFGSEGVTSLNGNTTPSPGEDLQGSSPLSRGTGHTQSCSTFIEHQYPAQAVQTPSALTDSSAAFTMSPLTSSAGRSGSVSLASGRQFETGEPNPGQFSDPTFNLFDAWSTSPSIKGNDIPLFSDTNNSAGLEGMTAPWMSSHEQHPELVNMPTNRLAHMSSQHLGPVNSYTQSRIRMTMEKPALETTNAVVELLLKSGAKVSMRADANSTVTLNLEDVMTETINSVLGVLFRTRTKIHMEAN